MKPVSNLKFVQLMACAAMMFWCGRGMATDLKADEALSRCVQNISQNFDFSEAEAARWCEFDSSDEFQACAKILKDDYHIVSWHAVTRCASNQMDEMLGCINERLGKNGRWTNTQAYRAVIQSGLEIYEPGDPIARARHYGKPTGVCSPYL